MVEKRRDRRLDLSLPLEYTVPAGGVSVVPKTGQTRNVSSSGVYFETEMSCLVGPQMDIHVKIAIPQRQDVGGNWIWLDKVASRSSADTGRASFELASGSYALKITGFHGYNWGNMRVDIGQTNVPIGTGH